MRPTAPRRHLHEELDFLQAHLMEMAGLAEEQVAKGVNAFLTRDPEAVGSMREVDRTIDDLEIRLDERVLELIALHQPVASDLRRIIAVQKACNEIERIGDHAVNIAKAARRLSTKPLLPDSPEFAELAVLAQRMLRDALGAFASRDPVLAREVCIRDDRVDEMRKTVDGLLRDLMASDPRRIEAALEHLRVSQQLERIGDLATNIAEDVVFQVEGRNIKHNIERMGPPPGNQ
jgi:phosphate transport system protein